MSTTTNDWGLAASKERLEKAEAFYEKHVDSDGNWIPKEKAESPLDTILENLGEGGKRDKRCPKCGRKTMKSTGDRVLMFQCTNCGYIKIP